MFNITMNYILQKNYKKYLRYFVQEEIKELFDKYKDGYIFEDIVKIDTFFENELTFDQVYNKIEYYNLYEYKKIN
jgi:hypothetical protein